MDSRQLTLLAFALLSTFLLTSAIGSRKKTKAPHLSENDVLATTSPGIAAQWFVQDKSNMSKCILASFNASFLITYTAWNTSSNSTYLRNTTLTFPMKETMVSSALSACGGDAGVGVADRLGLMWSDVDVVHTLQMMFNYTNEGMNDTKVGDIILSYDLDDETVFPDAYLKNKSLPVKRNAIFSGEFGTIKNGSYLKCDSGLFVSMMETQENLPVWGSLTGVKLEAFRKSNTSTFDDDMDVCPADLPTTPTIPTTTPTTPSTTESTTTESTTTTMTTESTSTPTPTPGPGATWWVDGPNGIKCVLANFNMTFNVTYNATRPTGDSFDQHTFLTVPQTATVNKDASLCNAGTVGMYNVLALNWMNGVYSYGLQLTFNHTGGTDNRTVLGGISLMYDLQDASIFPNATNVTGQWQRNANTDGSPIANLYISPGNYLKCDSGFSANLAETMEMKPLSASILAVKLEAFRMSTSTTFDDKEYVCSGDEVSTTTFMPNTTTMMPSTSTTQAPNVANYTVYNMKGEPCLSAVFGMSLDVLYYNTSNDVVNITLNDLNNATVNHERSFCGNETAQLTLEKFLDGWFLTFNFTHTVDKFSLENIVLWFNTSRPNFVNPNYTMTQMSNTSSLSSPWNAHLGKSYMCKVQNKWELNMTDTHGMKSVDLRLEQVRVEAFMVNGTFGAEEECSADNGPSDTNEIVPIAVGCALAALVIIVLIAYVIGRRRNRARGYESM